MDTFEQCSIAWMYSIPLPALFSSLTFSCLSFHTTLFRCLYFLFFLIKRKRNSYRYFDINSGISWVYLGRQKNCSQTPMHVDLCVYTNTYTCLTHTRTSCTSVLTMYFTQFHSVDSSLGLGSWVGQRHCFSRKSTSWLPWVSVFSVVVFWGFCFLLFKKILNYHTSLL